MTGSKLRKWLFFTLYGFRGQPVRQYYEQFIRQDETGIPPDTTNKLLVQLLTHCQNSVPYYSNIINNRGSSFQSNPTAWLQKMPILTKDIIRNNFDALTSTDLARRKWFLNTSGGSTGEPIEFLQDWNYATWAGAITLFFSKLAGKDIGESEACLWGAERDIYKGREHWRARLMNKISNITFLNAYRMTPDRMREFLHQLNTKRPRLLVSYVEALYDLARFAEREKLEVVPQRAIITSAGMLYPNMREKIETVFQCRVFNRYGSREVGDVGCERPGEPDLWVAPWGNYIEIVDSNGNPVPAGTSGEILITSLSNYVMPLIRYRIGDHGILSPPDNNYQNTNVQRLHSILGRIGDTIIGSDGTLIHGCYFRGLLFYKEWVSRYQVIQKDKSHIVFNIVKSNATYHPSELDDITAKTRLLMKDACRVDFNFVDQIPITDSGKYRYIISEVANLN